jgi:hypothetical protein
MGRWPDRGIGVWGTLARVVIGVVFVGGVLYSQATHRWQPLTWLLGLIVFPVVVVVSIGLRARRQPEPLRATGPVGHAMNVGIFLVLYLTSWYAPSVAVLSSAALVFYGCSMLLAAVRGYAACEVLAVSNWLLHRDDQVGCALFLPIDAAEANVRGPGPSRLPN